MRNTFDMDGWPRMIHNSNGSWYCNDCGYLVYLFDDDEHECEGGRTDFATLRGDQIVRVNLHLWNVAVRELEYEPGYVIETDDLAGTGDAWDVAAYVRTTTNERADLRGYVLREMRWTNPVAAREFFGLLTDLLNELDSIDAQTDAQTDADQQITVPDCSADTNEGE